MTIKWYGEGCFRIEANQGLDILVDPYESKIGLTPPRFHPNLVIETLSDSSFESEKNPESLVISGGGEYEFTGAGIRGFGLDKQSIDKFLQTAYVLNIEEMKIGLMGPISESVGGDLLDAMTGLDILIIPGGGDPYVSIDEVYKLIKKIEPKIIIPTFVAVPGLKRETLDVKEFIKKMSLNSENIEKLTIKKKELVGMKPKVLVMKI
jgi:L-ascorbate metabolism protein UlaG (beta-lactamase superfamily)